MPLDRVGALPLSTFMGCIAQIDEAERKRR